VYRDLDEGRQRGEAIIDEAVTRLTRPEGEAVLTRTNDLTGETANRWVVSKVASVLGRMTDSSGRVLESTARKQRARS
jgi:hypothetical protein